MFFKEKTEISTGGSDKQMPSQDSLVVDMFEAENQRLVLGSIATQCR